MKTVGEARSYLNELEGFKDSEIEEVLEGKHNRNFVFTSQSGKYVLRVKKAEQEPGKLENEWKILEFLDEQDIEFAPKTVHFDRNKRVHIVEFVGEEDVELGNLDRDELESWVSNLAKLHSISYQEFTDFCQRKGYEKCRAESRTDIVQKWISKVPELEDVPNGDSIVNWVKDRLEDVKPEIENESFERTGLTHGDLAHSTRKGDQLYLIDWEFAKVTESPELSLVKLVVNEVDREKFSEIVKIYRKETGIQNFEHKLEMAEQSERLQTIVWLLERSAKLKEREPEESKRLVKLAEQEKHKYTELKEEKWN